MTLKPSHPDEALAHRRYQLRKRREDMAETRRRIVEAAVELHGTVGPAKTTFSLVAERAGVQRSTLYRHFADEEALFGACTSHWLAAHPWPSPDDWRTIADPADRLRHGLRNLYRYYDANQLMLGNSNRDMDVMPAFVGEMIRSRFAALHAALLEAWPDDLPDRAQFAAAVRHALDFRAWRSLDDAGLAPDQAAALMARMLLAVATP